MSAQPRTPLCTSRNGSHRGRSSANASLKSRSPLSESSPTLVGDSPPPSIPNATPTSISVGLSQGSSSSSISFNEASTCLSSTGSSVSARKKPRCRKCGVPTKGHKRGVCPVPASGESWSLYASSPENERTTPTNIPAKPDRATTEKFTPLVSDTTPSSISVGSKRKQHHCRKCGLPMKGHKRPSGIVQCPIDTREPLDWEHDANLTPTPSSKLKTANVSCLKPLPSSSKMDDTRMYFLDTKPISKPTPSAKHDTSPTLNNLEGSGTLAGKGRRRRSITPAPHFALSEQRSSITPIRPVPSSNFQLNYTNGWNSSRQKSPDPPPPLSSASSCSSVSAYIPVHISESASQSIEIKSTFDDLCRNLGEPELAIYPACGRDEVARIRAKAKELHYFSGVVNIKMQGHDGTRDDNEPLKNVAELKEESHFYVKWVILSKKEEPVRRCVDLYKEHSVA